MGCDGNNSDVKYKQGYFDLLVLLITSQFAKSRRLKHRIIKLYCQGTAIFRLLYIKNVIMVNRG